MRTPLPALLLALAAGALRAELPPAVLDACLRPTLTEHASGQTWAAMTRAKWEAAPLRVHERGGLQVAEADGLAPTNGWAAVTLTLSQRPQTAANPRPMQTFAVSARPVHPLREATFDVALIRDAPLPPCSVRQWGGRVALVAEAGDWYVVAGDPKATLTRTEVRGGGAKPYRQKGTGRARQGSIVSPQFTGGGVVFAKKPRDFSQKINKNMKKAAFYSALSEKIRQEQVVVLDKFALAEAKTKLVADAVEALGLSGKTLFVVEEYDEAAVRASRNIPTVSLEEVRLLSVYDIVATRNIVLTKGAIKKIEEAAQ